MNEDRRALGFEPFDCAPALRLKAHEEIAALHIKALERRCSAREAMIAQIERRLWLTVYGVVAIVLGEVLTVALGETLLRASGG